MEKYDLIIVGAGPAGIFTAVELLRHGSKKKILLVEKGKPVEKRHCPKAELGHCVNCRPTCAITTGFSGAGAFSDGKLSLSYEVGGDLPTLIGEEFAQELIHYTDKIYLEFGADPHVEGRSAFSNSKYLFPKYFLRLFTVIVTFFFFVLTISVIDFLITLLI